MERKKYALVTGAGRGIGEAIARRLGQDGYNVAFTYRSSVDGALALQKELNDMGSDCQIYRADMSVLDEVMAAFDSYESHYEYLDVLVNNAGVTIGGPFLEATQERFDFCLNTDLRGPYFMSQRGAKMMIRTGSEGVIVNVASNQGLTCFDNASIYGSVKAGLIKLTRHMALELGRYNIRVNSLCPGYVDTRWNEPARQGRHPGTQSSETRRKFWNLIPLGSNARPDQVAGTVAFLASDDAIYITGSEIVADGGARLQARLDLPGDLFPDSVLDGPESIVRSVYWD